MPTLVLASQSPRRRAFLEQAGVSFSVCAPATDETISHDLTVEENTLRIATTKAEVVSSQFPESFVLSADTVVACDVYRIFVPDPKFGRDCPPEEDLTLISLGHFASDGLCLGKPGDLETMDRMLQLLSGRTHLLYSAFALLAPGGEAVHTEVVRTKVRFIELDSTDRKRLLHSGDGLDKAGGYAIQGAAGMYIEWIEGSYTGIVGLPMPEVLRVLKKHNLLNSTNFFDKAMGQSAK